MPHLIERVITYINSTLGSNALFNNPPNCKELKEDYEKTRNNIIKDYDQKNLEDLRKFNRCYNKLEETTEILLKDINQYIK